MVLPLASLAVIVIVCVFPAICVPVPVMTNRLAEPGLIVILPLVIAMPVAGVNVKVPEPTAPVYFKPKLVKLATPLLKSPALLSLVVPDNPEIAPLKLVLTVMLLLLASKLVTVFP
ncbi:hypothetical protein AQBE111736_13740 [Aquirufa beregesia]